jgi:hypothetical protein
MLIRKPTRLANIEVSLPIFDVGDRCWATIRQQKVQRQTELKYVNNKVAYGEVR